MVASWGETPCISRPGGTFLTPHPFSILIGWRRRAPKSGSSREGPGASSRSMDLDFLKDEGREGRRLGVGTEGRDPLRRRKPKFESMDL